MWINKPPKDNVKLFPVSAISDRWIRFEEDEWHEISNTIQAFYNPQFSIYDETISTM